MKKREKTTQPELDSTTKKMFFESEVITNRLASWCIADIIGLTAIFGLLIGLRIVKTEHPWTGRVLFVGCIAEILLFIQMKFMGNENPRTKYVVFTGLLFITGLTYFLYPLSAVFLFFGPTLLSVKYYDPKMAVKVTAISWAVFMVGVAANMIGGSISPELHNLHMEQGMIMWGDLNFTIKYYILPRTGVYIIEAFMAFFISRAGKKMIIRQADIRMEAALMSAELDTASKIQSSTLAAPEFTTPDGRITLAAQVKTARDVGGDFYDHFMLNDHLLAILVADVSDKGLPAAMYAVEAQSYIRFAFSEGVQKNAHGEIEFVNLKKIANSVNRQLSLHNMDGMFVTMWLACLDTRTGVGKFVNAGHNFPLVIHADGTEETVLNEPQVFMGAFEDTELTVSPLRLWNGDTLVLYTDGATDARNTADEAFGGTKLRELLVQTVKQGVKAPSLIRDTVIRNLEEFIGKARQYDDITVMTLAFDGGESYQRVELTLTTGENCATEVMEFTKRNLSGCVFPEDSLRNLSVIIDEVCSNITENAYGGEPGPLCVVMHYGMNFVTLRFVDSGIPFDPTAWEDPTLGDEPQIGGLGIHLVKKLSDGMKYSYKDGKNNLIVRQIWNM